MTKQDLRSGMVVKCRNGEQFQVFCNAYNGKIGDADVMAALNGRGWLSFNNFNDDLTCTDVKNYDIIEVYATSWHHKLTNTLNDIITWNRLWKREEPKELTVSDIEKLLGYPVKIVKE